MPVALPAPVGSVPQAPNAKAGGAAQRPAAGPVVPLTETRVAPEELMGGAGAAPAAATGATVTRALSKGEALAAPSGRADDFSCRVAWSRLTAGTHPCPLQQLVADLRLAPEAQLHRGDQIEPVNWLRRLEYALARGIDRGVRKRPKYRDQPLGDPLASPMGAPNHESNGENGAWKAGPLALTW
jgi:hypothetical protein